MVADCKPLNNTATVLFILWALRTKAGMGESVFKVPLMTSTRVDSTVTGKAVEVSFAANWISLLTAKKRKKKEKTSQSVYC